MAGPWREIALEPPVLGLDERFAYQQQPPYSTPRALNVRPYDVLQRRAGRIGVRPGLAKARGERLGNGTPIRLLNQLGYIDSQGYDTLADWFHTATVSPIWDQTQPWIAAPSIWPVMSSLRATSGTVQWGLLSGVDFFPDGHGTNAYMIDLFILPWLGKHWDSVFTIWARLNQSAPNPNNDCVRLVLTLNYNGTLSGSITLVKDGADIANQALTTTGCDATTPGMLRLKLSPGDLADAWYQGVHVLTGYDIGSLGANADHRFAFGLKPTKVHADTCALVDAVRCTRFNGLSMQPRKGLIAAANGYIYHELERGRLEQRTGTLQGCYGVADHSTLSSVERDGVLFVADWEALEVADDDAQVTVGDADDPTHQWIRSEHAGWGRYGPGASSLHYAEYGIDILNSSDLTKNGSYQIVDQKEMPDDTVTGVHAAGLTTISGTFGRFQSDMIGGSLIITDTGIFEITAYSSPTQVTVAGDATCAAKRAQISGYVNPHGHLRLGDPDTGLPAQNNVQYRAHRSPKVYDSTITDSGKVGYMTASKYGTLVGRFPLGYRLITLWRDRLCWAGHDQEPLAALMSRQGNPWDYDYSETDSQAAALLPVLTTGMPPDKVIAQMPQSDDVLVYGLSNAMCRVVGDPRIAGSYLSTIAYGVGVVGPLAWTHGPQGELIWLSRNGLWMLPAGATSVPFSLATNDPATGQLTVSTDGTLVSRPEYPQGKLPRALEHLDQDQYEVILCMDHAEQGVHIFVSPVEEGEHQHFWFDLTNLGFWPLSLDADHEPLTALTHYIASPDEAGVILGCRDGYLRHFRRVFQLDEEIPITSRVAYGPMQFGGGRLDAILDDLQAILDNDSGVASWSLYAASDAQTVLAMTFPQRTGTFVAGRNHLRSPRLVGASHLLEISGAQTRPWVLEQLLGRVMAFGPTRLP